MRIAKVIGLSFSFLSLGLAAVAQDAKPATPAASTAPAGEKIYPLDTNHSTIGFAAPILGMSEVTGKFTDFTGRIVVPDETDLTKANVEVVIKTASINSGIADRDKHLRTADFFDAEKYPEITFKSSAIFPKADGHYTVSGDLTIREVTRPVSFDVELLGTAANGQGGLHLGAAATLTIDRTDFGLTWNMPIPNGVLVGDKVKIQVDLEAIDEASAKTRGLAA